MTSHLAILEPFSALMLSLYRAARETPAAEFQEGALRLLKPVFGFDSSVWGCGTVSEAGLAVHAVHLHEMSAEFIEEWQHVNHQDPATTECSKRMGWVMNAYTPSLYREKDQAGIRDVATRFGIKNALVVGYSRRDMPLVNWISLYREDPDRHFSEDDRALLEALVPHVVEALSINRLINLDDMYTAHPHQRASLAIADRRGVIHYSDGSFEEVIRTEWPGWRSTVLPQPLIAVLNSVDAHAFRGHGVAVEVRQLADLYFLKARALTTVDALSLREREVAEHFGHGRSYKEVARLLGISPTTVRNHLQAVYGKLGVGDKAELAGLLSRAT